MTYMPNLNRESEDRQRLEHERELLRHEADSVRSFYSLTGAPRKDYAIQMAEAEAERFRITMQAQADGLLAIRKAEAEGYKVVGEALAQVKYPKLVVKLAGLAALQQVAQSLANGEATKIFLPQNLGDIFSLVGGWQEVLKPPSASDAQNLARMQAAARKAAPSREA